MRSDAIVLAVFIGGGVVVATLLAVAIIAAYRRLAVARSPWRWPPLLAVYLLVALGAYLFVDHYVETFGWLAAIWILGAPAVRGFRRGWPRSSA